MIKDYFDVVFFPDTLKRGGAERVTIRIAEYMQSQGLKVAIMTSNNSQDGEYQVPAGVTRICVGIEGKNLFNLIKGYHQELKKLKISMGIIMGLPQGCFIVPACKMAKVKFIISERNSPANFDGKKLTQLIMNFMMRFADGYVFQTSGAREYYKIRKPYEIIANPIDCDSIPEKKENRDIYNLISVGRYAPQKNHKMLIEAIHDVKKTYPKIHLDIYGEGQLQDELETLINSLGLYKEVCLHATTDQILNIEAGYGMFVLPSDFEGIPNVLLEAMAIGLPCISTDCPCGGPASVIDNRVNGLLVPVGDKNEMAKAIIWMIENVEQAEKMGERAKEIKRVLNIHNIGEKWIAFVSSLALKKRI